MQWAAKPGNEASDRVLHGTVPSIFQWWWLETEHAPAGPVAVVAHRTGKQLTFTLAGTHWGLRVRPSLTPTELDLFKSTAVAVDEWRHTERIWRELHKAASSSKRWEVATWAGLRLGVAMVREGRFTDAHDAFETASAAAIRESNPLAQAFVLQTWGDVFEQQARPEAAARAYSANVLLLERVFPDSLMLAQALSTYGNLGRSIGEVERAETFLQRALEIREQKAPSSTLVIESLRTLGLAALDRDDAPRAYTLLTKALQGVVQRGAPDPVLVISLRDQLADIAYRQMEHAAASDHLRRMLALLQQTDDSGTERVADVLTRLGLIAEDSSRWTEASDFHKRALAIRAGSATAILSLNRLAAVSRAQDQMDAATKFLADALTLHLTHNPSSSEAVDGMLQLAAAELGARDVAGAEKHLHQALETSEKSRPGGVDVARTLSALGAFQVSTGRFDEAEATFARSTELWSKVHTASLPLVADLVAYAEVAEQRRALLDAKMRYERALTLLSAGPMPGRIDVLERLIRLSRHLGDDPMTQKYTAELNELKRLSDVKR